MKTPEMIKTAVIDILKKHNASLEFYSDICKDMTMSIGDDVNMDMDYHPFTDRACNRVVVEAVSEAKQLADLEQCRVEIRALMVEHELVFSHYERMYDILIVHIGDSVNIDL